jgi:DNA/RNA-binding domain of Phe-tRNA-synthetase-like protein
LPPEQPLVVAGEIAGIVRPHAFTVAGVRASGRPRALDQALDEATGRLRARDVNPAITDAVRAMYRRLGVDPTKTRPSSEALLRRVRRGEPLPRVNALVDVINWSSAESGLPFGLYDLDRIEGPVEARRGRAGEEYAGIRKDVVHLEGRLTLADRLGPFGNPTSDSARTMITDSTSAILVVIFVPAALEAPTGPETERVVRDRIVRYAS